MDVEPKVEFSDTKPLDKKRSARKTKIIVCGILTLVLFLTTAVFVTVFIILKKTAPTRLVEVKLDEGETLTYQVDQNVEVKGGVVQKGMCIVWCSYLMIYMVLFLIQVIN